MVFDWIYYIVMDFGLRIKGIIFVIFKIKVLDIVVFM